ncbi:MAG: hypothetical protein ACI9G1_006010 [Pirellulaceae bacterium]|jgi:hypothetical protein
MKPCYVWMLTLSFLVLAGCGAGQQESAPPKLATFLQDKFSMKDLHLHAVSGKEGTYKGEATVSGVENMELTVTVKEDSVRWHTGKRTVEETTTDGKSTSTIGPFKGQAKWPKSEQ